ncbi:hypothetical protein WR25_06026 [Diploscapter pachys]|uniref:CS domain-containing protein n=1 Tax=Diploscapter pachys TaxID=2018661 RepID=A0A2A2LQF4_9BILA|nr:hypothetical protein WR25_06026 [Diploscapter pachys]
MASTSWEDSDPSTAPGPLGCRYDDSLTKLEVQLVVPGVRDKSWMKASNTQVFLKSDPKSMSCTVEIVKMDKKKKPPEKSIVDRRFYKIEKFPTPIDGVTFKLKKDCVVLTIQKENPASWENFVTQFGF